MLRYALIFAWTAGAAAGAEYDPVEVLRRASQRVLASARDMPNYTCVETVTRDYFAPAAATLPRSCPVVLEQRRHPTLDVILRPVSTDRLRLDVTMSKRGEIFSWSGASRFEDAGIERVVHDGPIAAGSFAGFLIAVFETDVKRFTFDETIEVDRRVLMKYSFQVAESNSHYRIKVDPVAVYVAYAGTFLVDPQTADVFQLAITTGDLPLATGLCQSTTKMEFARIPIGGGEFLMAKQAGERFVYPSAEETENTTGFTNCREFRGDSTVTFFAGPESEVVADTGVKHPAAKGFSLPGGLKFSIELTTSIQTNTAAAGDPFSAKLADPIRQGRKVLAPAGAIVEGHLTRVQSFFRPPEVVVVLRPEALWIKDTRIPVSAVRDWTHAPAETRTPGKKPVEIPMPWRGEDNSGALRFSGENVTVPSGFRSEWRTVLPAGSQPPQRAPFVNSIPRNK